MFSSQKGEGNIRAQYYTEIKKTFTRPSLANNLFTLYLTLWAIHMYTESICFILCVKVTYSDAIWRSRMVTQLTQKLYLFVGCHPHCVLCLCECVFLCMIGVFWRTNVFIGVKVYACIIIACKWEEVWKLVMFIYMFYFKIVYSVPYDYM